MVEVFNNLNSILPIRIKDRFGSYYTVYVEARKSVQFENYQLTDDFFKLLNSGKLSVLKGLSIKGASKNRYTTGDSVVVSSVVTENVETDTSKEENNNSEEDLPNKVDSEENNNSEDGTVVEQPTTDPIKENNVNVEDLKSEVPSSYTCDICGNEYASQRGLEMHKSKAHK